MIKSYTMKQVLLAAAAISGLALAATPSTATPLATGLIGTNSAAPITSGLVEKVYYKRYHHHAYYRYHHRRHHHNYYYAYYPYYYDYDYCDDYYGGYYGCGYPYRRYGYPFVPFIGFGFGFGGHHHHHHGHW